MFVRPSRRILLAALVPLLAVTAFSASGSVPAGYQQQSRTALAGGVHHEALTLADPAQSVNVARVAPGAARVVAVTGHDTVANQPSGGELPSEMCRRVGCLAGITADFREPTTGDAAGGVVSGGRLLRSPVPGRTQLVVTRDGRLHAAPLDWSGTVRASDGRTIAVGGINVRPRPGDVVLYTAAWGADTPEGADLELVVRSTGAIGAIGQNTPLEIVSVRSEPGPIPADGAVLAASGSASATLHELADLADAGRISRTLSLRVVTALDVAESVGGSPNVLAGGRPAFPDLDDDFTRARQARSLVGWNASGEVVLVTVDGGRADASGMTLAEAADLLAGLGATDGFGFDPQYATFVAGGALKNHPADDLERPAVNALMVVPKPADPPPTPPTTAASGTKPGTGATTTTAPVKVSGAGGGSATPGVAAPVTGGGSSILPGTVGDVLRQPETKRAKRPGGKNGKGKKNGGRNGDGDGDAVEEAYAGDPSIPGWDEITAALTPEARAARAAGELSLGPADSGGNGAGAAVMPLLLQAVAAGMIATVLWGLHRTRAENRPRPALWF